nr:nucleotidyltransferase family protein [Prevotella sp.]
MAKVWKIPDIFLYLHCLKIGVMRTVQDYIAIIRQNSSKITKDFGIKTLRIFGSVSRNEQTEQSDLDVCVETETPNPFLLADLKEFLEDLFKCSVDVVRIHKNMNPFFKSRIERDGIYAIS